MAILEKVFKAAVSFEASDIHVVPGEPFTLRRFGKLRKIKSAALTPKQCKQAIYEILSDDQKKSSRMNSSLILLLRSPILVDFAAAPWFTIMV